MHTYQTYTGLSPDGIFIDDCYILDNLTNQAQNLCHLPFDQKLSQIVGLCSEAMKNAHEQQSVCKYDPHDHYFNGHKKDLFSRLRQEDAATKYYFYKDIIESKPRLSYALQKKIGSDAHHAVLFFVLGFHAKLGNKQFVQLSQQSIELPHDVYNEVHEADQVHDIHVFKKITEGDLDRFRPGLMNLSEKRLEFVKGTPCFSYHRSGGGYVIAKGYERHIRRILK